MEGLGQALPFGFGAGQAEAQPGGRIGEAAAPDAMPGEGFARASGIGGSVETEKAGAADE